MFRSTAFLLCFLFLFVHNAMAMSEQQEISLGEQTAKKLESQYGLWDDKKSLNRLNKIGHSIAAVSERPHLKYSFRILNTKNVNALALPGGIIYATKGILPIVTDDELAFVLAHEVTHVAKRHSVKQIEKSNLTNIGLVTLTAIFNKGKVSEGSLNTASAIGTVLSSKYSRDDEKDADLTACQYLAAIGVNPRAGVSFMQKLQKLGGEELPGVVNSLVGDHPRTEERIQDIDEECRRLGY